MNKETLDEKILVLRATVLSSLLRKKKIKHSVSDLEKMVINRDDLSVYNHFNSRKNRKKKLIFYLIPITFVLLVSYIAYKYWPLSILKDIFLK